MTKNIVLLYDSQNIVIGFFVDFFSLIFEIYIDSISKNLVVKL